MMVSNNILVFRLEAFHTYFDNGLCPLQFLPDEDTQALQKRFGFLVNHRKNGFEWYMNSRSAIPDYLAYITKVTGADRFTFNMQTHYQGFYSFTQLPTGWAGQFTYDSKNNSSTANGFELQPELSKTAVDGPLGKLTIWFKDIALTGDPEKARYSLRFTARSTQWQYYVVNSSQVPLNQPLIKGMNGDAFQFTGPQTVTIPNGQEALLFTSDTRLIPLSEMPKNKFSLFSRPEHTGNNVSAKPVFKNLPQPDPLYSDIVQVNGARQTSSPMYVYL